jgi:hypothetical protein
MKYCGILIWFLIPPLQFPYPFKSIHSKLLPNRNRTNLNDNLARRPKTSSQKAISTFL